MVQENSRAGGRTQPRKLVKREDVLKTSVIAERQLTIRNEFPAVKFVRNLPKDSPIGWYRHLLVHDKLNQSTITDYRRRIAAGEKPTALAISVLDTKQPAL